MKSSFFNNESNKNNSNRKDESYNYNNINPSYSNSMKIYSLSQVNKLRNSKFFNNDYNKNKLNIEDNLYSNPTSFFGNIPKKKVSNPYLKETKLLSNNQIYSSRFENKFNEIYFSEEENEIKNEKSKLEKNYFNSTTNQITTSKIGLQNLGNTCYMNTTLQILIHTPNFINRFLNEKNIDKKCLVSKVFYELISQILKSKKFVSPIDFKNLFSKKHFQFKGNEQYDTQEFCRVFLEDINLELNKIKKKPNYKELETKNKSKNEIDKEYFNLCKLREDSLITETFYGQIINIFTCICGKKTFSFQKILDLPLLIPKSKSKNIKLKDLINLYFQSEEIEFESKCEKCKQKTIHIKESFFSHPPEILILSLQRINNRTRKKNEIPIQFNEVLNLNQFIDEDCNENKGSSYVLYGIVNHIGNIEIGHYFCYVKIGANWFEFNDSIVNQIGKIEVISSNVYVLFYRRNDA